jgi:hypothetical protein
MPAIDITAPAGLFPAGTERQLAKELTEALLAAEGAPLAAPYLENTAAYLHLMPTDADKSILEAGIKPVYLR